MLRISFFLLLVQYLIWRNGWRSVGRGIKFVWGDDKIVLRKEIGTCFLVSCLYMEYNTM